MWDQLPPSIAKLPPEREQTEKKENKKKTLKIK
jgi:hypothetical protein